ncbi:MAG: hypothetical protein M3A24_00310 [Candidatus Rhabdochlamydia oedothoracis]|nr:hypothetical protein [Candidatus Rhabdochlamydia oedothoracis]
MISDHKQKGGLNDHARAVAQAVHSIALATLVNTPYYLALGSKNLCLNCIHLNLEHMVLGHYKSAMQNLIYSVIATIYAAMGIFIPSVLDGFKMGESQPDDLNPSPDSGMPSVTNQEESERSETRSFFNTSLGFRDQNGIDNEHESRNSMPSQLNSIQTFSIEPKLDSLSVSGGWTVIPNIESFVIKSTNIRLRDMIGAYGVNLERQAYRTALNEYIRILWDDFNINVNERLGVIENWLKGPAHQNNPMISALYRTLLCLIKPIAYYNDKSLIYTHAKEHYEKYVTSLREIIATEQYQSIRQDPNLNGDLKECLTLTRALCEARFRSENHGLLRSLLQLHEDEYDRLHPKRKEIPAITRENFARVIIAKNEKVNEAPASMKVSLTQRSCRMAYGAVGFEDFLMTDIPFLRGKQVFVNDQGVERSFYYMRHPTPHVEGSPAWITLGAMSRMLGSAYIESGEAIAPEFEGMLGAIAERKESYLIQSHQRLNDLGKVENEDSRSQTLYRLQESHKNFHVVFQAVEGDLFDRIGSYAKITTFADLKEEIKASFEYEKRDTSPNRLPACLEKDEEYRGVIDQLLNQVHQTLFEGRPDISFDGQDPTQPGIDYPNREWQAFILAFYILQGDDLKFRLPNVKYFCTNCKNFFDRGGNRAMAEDRLHQEMSEKEVTNEDLEATITNLIPVPLQSKGKAVIEKRLKPGLALAEILAALPVADRQRLQEIRFKEGYKPERFEVSKKEQRAVPLIEDVCTLQEMQEVLRALQGRSYLIVDNDIVQKNWETYQGKDQSYLFDQIDSDLKRSTVYVDGTCYNGQVWYPGTTKYNAEGIFEYLISRGISEKVTLQAMAQMQQGIFVEPFNGLQETFKHDHLDLSILQGREKHTILAQVETDSIIIEAKKSFRFLSAEHLAAVFDVTICAKIPKDGSAPNGRWTWAVA